MHGLFEFKNEKNKIEKVPTVFLPDLSFLSCNKKF